MNNKQIEPPVFYLRYRSYFSRITRERRTKENQKRTTVSASMVSPIVDEEDQQLQEEEDDSDFDSALISSQAYNLLDNAMQILDDMIQRQSASSSTDC